MTTHDISILGNTPDVLRLREDAAAAARTDAKVLITGESGVGKEVVSQVIHAQSRRAAQPFVTINCAAIAETLLESELFGHARGSFTDAHRDRTGFLERAHHGTAFMDEIGETTPRMQGLLLRFLETGEIQPVGSDRIQTKVDVRIIAATNRVLLDQVEGGRFRRDLYYRLNVIHLRVPPLRERRDDLPLLLEYFFQSFAVQYGTEIPRLSKDALELCLEYDWPGNIRELKNVAERIVVLPRRSGCVEREDIPLELSRGELSGKVTAQWPLQSVADRLLREIVDEGESFWSAAYAPFMTRDVTREDLRGLVTMGLKRVGGDYRALTRLFNMPEDDATRLVAVLRKYHCHVPVQRFPATRAAKPLPPSTIAV
jgi:transcriptional regulator with PAS, ATPase and Fis domain